MRDRLHRPLRDLRISVTDRCNFRCTYCMPAEVFGPGFAFLPRTELLSFEEIARLAGIFAAAGVRKLRITGGEPLLRRDLPELIAMLAAVEGIEDIALTTNGSLLASRAEALAAAGLGRVTVSLDAIDETIFAAMNGVNVKVARVLAGVDAAQAAGLGPVKVNMVVKRGVNDGQILPMARYAREHGLALRFIEFMDVGTTNGWCLDEVVSAAEIHDTLQAEWPLEPVAAGYAGEVAQRYRYRDGSGEIGIIASVSQPFCGGCTRARLSADGQLFTCLFGAAGHDLRAPLRSGASDPELAERIAGIWSVRNDRYSEQRSQAGPEEGPRVEMSYIGG